MRFFDFIQQFEPARIQRIDAMLEDFGGEGGFGSEMIIDGGEVYAGGPGNVADGNTFDAAHGEQLFSRFNNALPCLNGRLLFDAFSL